MQPMLAVAPILRPMPSRRFCCGGGGRGAVMDGACLPARPAKLKGKRMQSFGSLPVSGRAFLRAPFALAKPSLETAPSNARLRESCPFPQIGAPSHSLAWLVGGGADPRRFGVRALLRPARAPAGRERPHHLSPRSRRLARDGRLD